MRDTAQLLDDMVESALAIIEYTRGLTETAFAQIVWLKTRSFGVSRFSAKPPVRYRNIIASNIQRFRGAIGRECEIVSFMAISSLTSISCGEPSRATFRRSKA